MICLELNSMSIYIIYNSDLNILLICNTSFGKKIVLWYILIFKLSMQITANIKIFYQKYLEKNWSLVRLQ